MLFHPKSELLHVGFLAFSVFLNGLRVKTWVSVVCSVVDTQQDTSRYGQLAMLCSRHRNISVVDFSGSFWLGLAVFTVCFLIVILLHC